MGYYINPPNESKEAWLAKHGRFIQPQDVEAFDFTSEYLPVCLVDNGGFTAAGIAYCKQEAEAFSLPDRRAKVWFTVRKTDLEPFLDGNAS